jgi:putative membrane protein
MTTKPPIEEPRAFRLDGDAVIAAKTAKVTVTPEAGPTEPETILTPRPARGFRWAGALLSSLAGLLALSLALWAQDAVIGAMRRSDILGLAALALSVVILVAALVLGVRFIRQLVRERKVEALKRDAASVLDERSPERARAIAERLVKLQAARPETAAGRARFAAALPAMTDARDIIALAERELVEPLDRLAANEIANAARQVATVTAVSPRALIDLVFVVFAGGRLITRVAGIYGGRPGWLGFLRIARASLEHLLVTGGLAAGQTVVQQIIGQGLAARLSAKLGEGVLNGLMTARFGLAALTVCRPLPFVESKPPELTDVAAGLLTFGEKDPA